MKVLGYNTALQSGMWAPMYRTKYCLNVHGWPYHDINDVRILSRRIRFVIGSCLFVTEI